MVKTYKMKLCMAGEGAVGKTSLIGRFVHDTFSDEYLMTVGAKVSTKTVRLVDGTLREPVDVVMTIWDIMGQKPFRELMKESYFYGTDAVFGVCDLTRRDTLYELQGWFRSVQEVTGTVPVLVAANKVDLVEERVVSEADLSASFLSAPHFMTSAKTGEGVDEAFQWLARTHVAAQEDEAPAVAWSPTRTRETA